MYSIQSRQPSTVMSRVGSESNRQKSSADKGREFIEYATKLGYERRLAEIAVQRLGGGASTNDLLRTVINLFRLVSVHVQLFKFKYLIIKFY